MSAQTVTVYKRGKGKANVLSLNANTSRKKEENTAGNTNAGATHSPRSHRSTLGFGKRNDRFGGNRKARQISDEQAESILRNYNHEESENHNSFAYADSDAHSMNFNTGHGDMTSLNEDELDQYAEMIAQRLSPEKQNHFFDAPAPKRKSRFHSQQNEESVAFDQTERDMQLMEFQNKGGEVVTQKPTFVEEKRTHSKGRVSNHLGRRSRSNHRSNRPEREKMSFISHDDPSVDFSTLVSGKASFVSHEEPKAELITHETPKVKKFEEFSFDDVEPNEVKVNLMDFALDN